VVKECSVPDLHAPHNVPGFVIPDSVPMLGVILLYEVIDAVLARLRFHQVVILFAF